VDNPLSRIQLSTFSTGHQKFWQGSSTVKECKFSMTAGRHSESMKNTNYHLLRLAVESYGIGEVEIVEIRGITAGFSRGV
jgi:hypothetical protein